MIGTEYFHALPTDEDGWRVLPSGRRVHVGRDVQIGEGAVIEDRVFVHNGASVCDFASIGRRAYVGRQSTVGRYTQMHEFSEVRNNVQVGEKATIGRNATVCAYCTIGDRAIIPAHARIEERVKVRPGAHVPVLLGQFPVNPCAPRMLRIACSMHTYDEWRRRGREIAKEWGFLAWYIDFAEPFLDAFEKIEKTLFEVAA